MVRLECGLSGNLRVSTTLAGLEAVHNGVITRGGFMRNPVIAGRFNSHCREGSCAKVTMQKAMRLGLFGVFLCVQMGVAQPPDRRRRGGAGRVGSARLTRAGLKLGMSLPTAPVYDESGQEFKLSSLKGEYVVVVFGCLT